MAYRGIRNYGLLALLAGCLLAGCSTYKERVSPVLLPSASVGHINIRGARIAATSYVDEKKAKSVFGYDVRGMGLLPVRLVIDNQSREEVNLQSQQTFLIDNLGQAWPLLTIDQAYRRVSEDVEFGETLKGTLRPSALMGAAGALAGLAIGIISGGNIGDTTGKGAMAGAAAGALYGGATTHDEYGQQILNDLARYSLRTERISPGELAYGYLFFPGRDEARSAKALRLGVMFGKDMQVMTLPLFEQ
ncbi:MAG: hypothetical protein M8364_00910 [Methylobacter sp.]|uniref:hypothetical protein n=1 Tax=Methylobacter sp. TaxID=2051955 RepID=UPI00258419F3|nr:hypothetical protein [Methylobacter sp.]MCL7419452.1 hypothetical protein [Methylobacter sp.]